MTVTPFPPDEEPSPRQVLDWLAAREEEIAALVTAALDRIVVGAYEAFVATLTAAGDFTALDTIPNAWLMFVEEELVDELGDTFLAGSMTAFMGMKNAPTQKYADTWAAVMNQAGISYQAQATNRLVGVGQTTWELVRKQTVAGIKAGLTHDEMSAKVRDVTEFSKHRADTIARTEVNGAFINGDMAGAQALGPENGPVEKVWKATNGPRTRPSHAAADDQVRDFAEPFDVGGVAMMNPHAPGAPASEVVNCRCYVAFLYEGDARPDGTIVGPPVALPPVKDEYDPDLEALLAEEPDLEALLAEEEEIMQAQKAPTVPPAPPPPAAQITVPTVKPSTATWDAPEFDFDAQTWTKPVNQPQLGGVHRKWVIDTPDGQYLVKPGELHVIKGESAAAAIARRAGFDVPEVMVGRVDGEWVSVQKMIPSARRGFPGSAHEFDPSKVTRADLSVMQDHRALDWMIGNHDDHAGQWVREGYANSGGKLIGIDKGQAFKNYGKGERLHYDYDPNGGGGFASPVHNITERRFATGALDESKWVDYSDVSKPWDKVDALMAIPDDEYRAMLRPYADGRFATDSNINRFLDDMVERKNTLRTTMADYHTELGKAHRKATGAVDLVPFGETGGPKGSVNSAVQSEATTEWMRVHDSPLTDSSAAPGARHYTGGAYATINSDARAGRISSTHEQISAELGELKTDMILHRGTTLSGVLPPAGHVAMQGSVFVDNAFISTSAGGTPAFSGDTYLRIRANAGTKASWVKPISQHSSENEVLLDRGQHLYVHRAYRAPRPDGYGEAWWLDVETVDPTWARARADVKVWDTSLRAWVADVPGSTPAVPDPTAPDYPF